MKKTLGMVFILFLCTHVWAFAHVTNEKTIYNDIEFSKAKEQIVYLRGIDAIAHESGANLFKPQEKLTRAELAFWAATFNKLGEHDAKKDALQKAAKEKGLITSLEGNATYEEVNKAYFGGKASTDKAKDELTKEEFALYLGKYLKEKVEGKTLIETAGLESGPKGKVEKVSFAMEGQGDAAYKVFRYTIGGTEYQVSQHPKILYGPVDLGEWEGKQIEESWLASGTDGKKVVQIIKVSQGQFTDDQVAKQDPAGHGTATEQNNTKAEKPDANKSESTDQAVKSDAAQQQTEAQSGSTPYVLIIGIILIAVILGWLFMKKKKN